MSPTPSVDAGLRRFIGFALAPNERGFCGPADHALLRDHLRDGSGGTELARLARAFSGPLPYLQVIADAAGIADPFDPQVVGAYWLGGDLLDAVDPQVCAAALLTAFAGQPTVDPRRIEATRDAAVPSHAYHVLVTYPWIDLVAAGRPQALQPLDDCRVRWGEVVAVADDAVEVSVQPLEVSEGRLALGAARVDLVRPVQRPDAPSLAVGDVVALHWDHLCDRLTAAEVRELATRTAAVMAVVNDRLLGG